jgi:argininosuccinate synthase
MPKVALAYSGGLDTSVAVKWLQEVRGLEVIAIAVDVGEQRDYEAIRKKALDIGAIESLVIDAKEDFAREFVFRGLKANALYEGKYPVATAMARPLIAKIVGQVARDRGAQAVAHGCTGKGNDQVRFDVTFGVLYPELQIHAPFREWKVSRDEEMDWARERGVPVPTDKKKPYSTDVNLWGRSIECGVLEDPWQEPPADVYEWTRAVEDAPAKPAYVEIGFEGGVPVSLDGKAMSGARLIGALNALGGEHGVGRIDMIENRLVGFKSREIYECPAATVLLTAHRDLEAMTVERELAHYKQMLDMKYAELIYYGLWYSPLREALDAFIDKTQERVTGTVRMKLHRGVCSPVGRRSPYSLYSYELATYDKGDQFDASLSKGFVQLFGLSARVAAEADRKSKGK